MKLILIIVVLTTTCLTACNDHRNTAKKGDKKLLVFENEHIQFVPGVYNSTEPGENNIIHIADGRILLKKIEIPKFERNVQVAAKVTLASSGDRWDKSGSCFIIPKESIINILSVTNKTFEFPVYNEGSNNFSGIILDKNYLPALELMRFMTPFGIGAYNDSINFRHRKPVYIPFWEKEVVWEQDISHLISELQGETYIGIWIDTWTEEGYKASVELNFDESHLPCDVQKTTSVLPLVNTVYYIDPIKYVDLFARKDLIINFELPKGVKNPKLYYLTTGHGGHSGGDEFTKNQHILTIDKQVVLDFIPWRDDCSTFRRFNPATGVWLIKDTAQYIDWETHSYKEKLIEERIASSDLSRSNWCPGSTVNPEIIPITNIKEGKHSLTISIPNSQEIDGNKLNHWLISAYIAWEY